MINKKCIGLLLILTTNVFADKTYNNNFESFSLKSIDEAVNLIFPDAKIWRIDGIKPKHDQDKGNYKIEILFIPFVTSSNFCRYSSLIFKKPTWNEKEPSNNSYDIYHQDYVAIIGDEDKSCTDIEIDRYFEITVNSHDLLIKFALDELKANLVNLKTNQNLSIQNVNCLNKDNIGNYLTSINVKKENRDVKGLIYDLKACKNNRAHTKIKFELNYSQGKAALKNLKEG